MSAAIHSEAYSRHSLTVSHNIICAIAVVMGISAIQLSAQSFNYFPTLTVGKLDGIVYVDGVTYTSVAAAMDALPTGGGTVVIPCSSTPYAGPDSSHFRSGIHLRADCAAVPSAAALAEWGGPEPTVNTATLQYSGSLTIGSSSGPLYGIGIDGVAFDFQGTGGLTLQAVVGSYFNSWSVINCASTVPCLRLTGNSVSGIGQNQFLYTFVLGGSKTMQWDGYYSGGTELGAVTGNYFHFLEMAPGGVGGLPTSFNFLEVTGGADTNYIDVVLASGPPPGYSGVVYAIVLNDGAPTSNHGVYDNELGRWDFNNTNSSNPLSQTLDIGNSGGDRITFGLPANGPNLTDSGNNPTITYPTGCYQSGGTSFACDIFITQLFPGSHRGIAVPWAANDPNKATFVTNGTKGFSGNVTTSGCTLTYQGGVLTGKSGTC